MDFQLLAKTIEYVLQFQTKIYKLFIQGRESIRANDRYMLVTTEDFPKCVKVLMTDGVPSHSDSPDFVSNRIITVLFMFMVHILLRVSYVYYATNFHSLKRSLAICILWMIVSFIAPVY